MAALVPTAAAASLTQGAAVWITAAATAVATAAGSYLDARLFGPGPQKQEGPRLDNLHVQASTEGAPIPEIAGRARLAGQIIWATKFKEVAKTESSGGGGKGGGGSTVETTTYTYYANFAVGLCEGVIDRIGRVWADGKQLDMSGVTMRVHKGAANQAADSLIEGIEGAENAPAYRGTAYVVFDNLQITQFGNRLPQLSFEVFRRVSPSDGSGLEDIIQAVTLIPGAGERVYDTIVHTRDLGGGATTPENEFAGQDTADWNVALDDLEASLPNAGAVLLVVGWFGDDLRAGNCTIRPEVEVTAKTTTPNSWKVHMLTRDAALVVSTFDGRPAYGGTPSDDSVVRAIRDLKARGHTVVFYPFVFMDIAEGNSLTDPWTGNAGQPVYPWRGRITCDPAPGRPGTVDKTSGATSQVNSFFGAVATSDITVSVNGTTNVVVTGYSGPNEWSFRRFILHCAKLCAAINAIDAGAVDAFLIGSELKSLTMVRDGATNFPAVAKMKTLAADVKSILGAGVKVGYAADWSEYNNYNPGDGTGDLFFHLDPLWSDSNVDFVGVDLYVPLSDWRDGNAHLDAIAGAASIYDLDYLRGNVEGGENYDWYYADATARDTQARTTITDGAYGKPWVFRAKDFRNWWLNQHYNRPGGVQSGSPSGWTPQSKPVWFTEFGIPSIDKGTNQPNVFYDPKSSESLFPYYSRGTRDDLIQRRGIEAMVSYWGVNNPVSSVYGGPMIELLAVWTWDARPYPAWPSRTDAWGDGDLWPFGHWLNGKVGLADLAALVAERCKRVGFTDYDVTALAGIVVGYVRDRPMSPRAEIELLMNAFAFDAVESEGVIRFLPRSRAAVAAFDPEDCVLSDQGDLVKLTRAQETDLPDIVSLTFIDASGNYEPGTVSASRIAGYSERKTDVTVPLVMDEIQAQAIADRALAEAWIGRETSKHALPPDQIALDAGDVINLIIDGKAREFRLTRINDAWARSVEGQRAEGAIYSPPLPGNTVPVFDPPPVYGRAILELLDLPMLRDSDIGFAPYVGASASPFAGITLMDSATGDSFAVDTILPIRATVGETVFNFYSGPIAYFDTINTLRVKLYSGELASASEGTVLAGRANAIAIRNAAGDWEILQFCTATLASAGVYDLTKLLRGRLGTEHAMQSPVAAGARVVALDGAIAQIQAALAERGVARFYKWGPTSLDPSDVAWQQGTFTARCVGLMPWSPVHVAGIRNGAGDLSITWVRRTRYGGVWTDGTDVPLNEESERYEVNILDGSDVVRTLVATSTALSYT
ncbi:MAG: baseplate multidomain protein megatron, partial [Pseudolabrys sp.]